MIAPPTVNTILAPLFALVSVCQLMFVIGDFHVNNIGLGEIRLCCEIGSSFYPRNSCQPSALMLGTHSMHHTFYRNVFGEDDVVDAKSHLLRDFDSVIGVPGCTDLIMIPLKEAWKLFRVRGVVFRHFIE